MSEKVLLMGIYIGVFVILFVIGLLIRGFFTKGEWKCKFDERQEILRGRGYKYGFYALLIYNVVDFLVINLLEYSWAEEYVDLLIGMLIGLGVYAVYCIMHEAFLSLNQNPKRYALVLVFVGLANGISAIRQLRAGEEIIRNGRLSSNCANLLCALFMFVILAAMLLKHFMSKREVD